MKSEHLNDNPKRASNGVLAGFWQPKMAFCQLDAHDDEILQFIKCINDYEWNRVKSN